MSDERLIDIVDNDWRNEKLPNEDIQLPLDKLPDPEDNENQTMKEVVSLIINNLTAFNVFFLQEDKWQIDLAIMNRHTAEDALNSSNP